MLLAVWVLHVARGDVHAREHALPPMTMPPSLPSAVAPLVACLA